MVVSIIALVVLIFFVLILWGTRAKKSRLKNEYYTRLSEKYDLKKYTDRDSVFTPKKYTAEGEIKGHHVRIFDSMRGRGNARRYYTNIHIPFKANCKFKIGKESFFTQMAKWVGFTDIEFARKEVDREYLFKSNDEQVFRGMITSEILNLLEKYPGKFHGALEYEKDYLVYKVQADLNSEERQEEIENILNLMLKFIDQ